MHNIIAIVYYSVLVSFSTSLSFSSEKGITNNLNISDLTAEMHDLIMKDDCLTHLERKNIFNIINHLSGKDYLLLLKKIFSQEKIHHQTLEKKVSLFIFPDTLDIPDLISNKNLFLSINYKNKDVQSIKYIILKSTTFSEEFKNKVSTYLSSEGKQKAYEKIGLTKEICPEILPVNEWDSKFLEKSISCEQQQQIIENLTGKLKNLVEFLMKLNSQEDISSSDIKDLSFLYQETSPCLEACLQLSPPSSIAEIQQLENAFSEETFPLLKKLQSERFSLLQRYPNNSALIDLQNQFNRTGNSYDSYLIDAGIIRILKKRDNCNYSTHEE